MIDVTVKYFNELTLDELYGLLLLRSEVFVVEQDCVYQDVDNKDQKALHVLGKKNNKIIAYARAFKAGDYFKEASIGRVVVSHKERRHNYGYDIMKATTEALESRFGKGIVKLSAQTYLKAFYNNLGFKEEGEEYMEDGIPHIAMILE